MDQRKHVVACARQFLDVRFQHQGRSASGLDCLGLLFATAATARLMLGGVNIQDIDVPTYGARPDTALLQEKLAHFLIPISLHDVQLADVVLLKVQGSPQHLAILSDYPMQGELGMLHAYAPAGKVVEHRYDAVWRRQTYAAYRLPRSDA